MAKKGKQKQGQGTESAPTQTKPEVAKEQEDGFGNLGKFIYQNASFSIGRRRFVSYESPLLIVVFR